jgi:hypothetical protein
MTGDAFEFLWEVTRHGYQWVSARGVGWKEPGRGAEPVRVLIEAPTGSREVGRVYDPLEECPALFRDFAALPVTEEAILDFANRFGSLELHNRFEVPHPNVPDDPETVSVVYGDELRRWREQIDTMRVAVELWDATRTGDRGRLTERIRWGTDAYGGPRVSYHDAMTGPAGVLIASSTFHPDLLARWRENEPIRPARAYLRRIVNKASDGCASPRLLEDLKSGADDWKLVPSSLLGSLWLQLGEAIGRNKKHRECSVCKRWFEIKEHGGRKDKQFCGPNCRTRVYRQRQEQARQLRAEGKTPKAIAQKLGTDTKTINRWLKPRKG